MIIGEIFCWTARGAARYLAIEIAALVFGAWMRC
jgi:hypothetical protein